MEKILFGNLDILLAASHYGLQCKKISQNKYKSLCCFHNERTASLTFFTGSNTFYCFGCGAKGSVWEFVRLQEQTNDKRHILQTIQGLYGLVDSSPTSVYRPLPKTPQPTPKEQPKKELVTSYHTVYLDLLDFCSQHPNAKGNDYLTKERGLSERILTTFKIQTFEGKQLESYLRSKYTSLELNQFGLVSEKGTFLFRNYQILIPYYSLDVKIFQLQARTLSPNDYTPKYKFLQTHPIGTYNLHSIGFWRECKCAITEGALDCLSVYELNSYLDPTKDTFDLVVGVPSANAIDRDLLVTLQERNLDITVFIDKDQAGTKAMERLDKIANEVGLQFQFRTFKHTKDVNEYLMSLKR